MKSDRQAALMLAEQYSTKGQLPAHRRAIHGRTHSRSYYPADYDPIQGFKPRRRASTERIYGVLLVTLIGVFLAAWLCHWWDS